MTWAERQAKTAARRAKRRDNRRFIAKTQGKPIRPNRKAVSKQIDSLCSLIVRIRDKAVGGGYCLVCLAKKRLGMIADRSPVPYELAYHVVSRGHAATRWRLDNQVAACRICNRWEQLTRHQQPQTVRRVHIELVGEKLLNELETASATTVKYSTAELVEIRDGFKNMLSGEKQTP